MMCVHSECICHKLSISHEKFVQKNIMDVSEPDFITKTISEFREKFPKKVFAYDESGVTQRQCELFLTERLHEQGVVLAEMYQEYGRQAREAEIVKIIGDRIQILLKMRRSAVSSNDSEAGVRFTAKKCELEYILKEIKTPTND